MLNAEKSRYSSGKAVYKVFLMLLIIAAGFTNLYAQSDKVLIKLSQPPPNKLGVGDMWNLELTNTTKSDLKIYLTGTATEEKDGLIIDGKTKVFTIKPGRSTYKYNDFSGAEVKYNNGKYKEIILRTGNAPEGSYTICVTAYDESGTEVGRENCIMQTVQQLGSITLISPEDNIELDPDTLPGLMFSWTPLPKGGPYSLRIVELKGSESKEEGIRANRPIIDKEKISMSSYQLGSTDPKLEAGKRYAWQVTSGDITSEAYTIHIKLKRPPLNELITQFKLELQKEGKTVNETKTDTSGNFRFSSVENGEYRLKITSDGSPMPDRLLLSFGPGGIIICCCPGPPCDDPLVIVMGDEKTSKLKALYFEGGEISAKILPFPPVGPHIPHR